MNAKTVRDIVNRVICKIILKKYIRNSLTIPSRSKLNFTSVIPKLILIQNNLFAFQSFQRITIISIYDSSMIKIFRYTSFENCYNFHNKKNIYIYFNKETVKFKSINVIIKGAPKFLSLIQEFLIKIIIKNFGFLASERKEYLKSWNDHEFGIAYLAEDRRIWSLASASYERRKKRQRERNRAENEWTW